MFQVCYYIFSDLQTSVDIT